jgi:acetyl-CoA acetyltransferase
MSSAHSSDWGFASELDDVSGAVAIVGIGDADYTRASGRTTTEIAAQATERALADAGLAASDVDGIMYVPFSGDQFTGRDFHAHFGTSHALWESDRGGGMVWAGSAPYDAALAIREGRATCVLNTFSVAWATQRTQMVGGPGQVHAEDLFKQNLEVPVGWFPQPVYFANIARRHMHEFGTTPEQLGAIAVACRKHAGLTPSAVMRNRPLSLADYLASPLIADPFRKEDCCLISDGGAAYLMTSLERARDLRQPIIAVLGVGVGNSRTGAYWSQQSAFTSTPQAFAAPGRVRDGGPFAEGRRRAGVLRPVHDRLADADRGHGLLREGRGAARSSPATACTSTPARCPTTPTAACCRMPTCSGSPTSSRSSANSVTRAPRRCATHRSASTAATPARRPVR